MGISKSFVEFKGVFSRSSDLLRPEEYFSDALNTVVSKKQSIKKRRGTTNVATGSGGNGLVNYNGDTALIGIDTTVRDLSTGAWVAKTNSGSNTLDTTNLASFAQDNQRLFIANAKNELMKYDGLSWYRAGCPNAYYDSSNGITPDSAAVAPVAYEVISQFASRDPQGNFIDGRIAALPTDSTYSPAAYNHGTDTTQLTISQIVPSRFWASLSAGAAKWAQNTLYATGTNLMAPDNKIYICLILHTSTNTGAGNELADFYTDYKAGNWRLRHGDPCGFNNRFGKVNGNQSSVNTVTVDAGHGIIAGDYIFVRTPAAFLQAQYLAAFFGRQPLVFENWRRVTAVAATTITFNGDKVDFVDDEIISPNLTFRLYRRISGSSDAFVLFFEWGVDPTVVKQTVIVPVSLLITGYEAVDPAQLRDVPPKGRYLTIFQNLLIIAGKEDDPYNIYWSNTENLETFDPSNFQILGDSRDGVITGLAVNNDYLIVFKKKKIYFLSGALSAGNYRVESVPCGDIGCQAHATIKDVRGTIYFLDATGVFKIRGGGMPEEASFNINEKFTEDTTGLDFTKAVALVDDPRHHYKLCMPAFTGAVTNANTRIFVLDYEYDAWWIHASIDYSGGADIFNSLIYFTIKDVAVTTRKEQATFNDNGSVISAYVKTHWHNFGDPSIPKKFIDYKAYALEGSIYTLRVRSEKDWVAGTTVTDFNLAFTAATRFAKNNAVSSHERAVRLYLSNDTLNEDMEITGIEIEVEAPWKELMKR